MRRLVRVFLSHTSRGMFSNVAAHLILKVTLMEPYTETATLIHTVVYRTVASNGTCDSVRPVINHLGFVFQVGHLFILVFLLFLITASHFGCSQNRD